LRVIVVGLRQKRAALPAPQRVKRTGKPCTRIATVARPAAMGTTIAPEGRAMRLPRPQPSPRLRRDPKRRPTARATAPSDVEAGAAAPAREPDDEHARAEVTDAGFRASSYELQRGLDVVELPTSLPPDVLDRLFKTPPR